MRPAHAADSRALVRMASSYFCLFTITGMVAPFLSPLLLQLGFSRQETGFVHGASALCATLSPIVAGRICDRYLPAERLAQACAAALVLTAALRWWGADSAVVLTVLVLAFAALRAPLAPLHDTLAMQVAGNSARLYGRLRVMGSMGFVVSSMLAGWLRSTPASNASTDGQLLRYFPLLLVLASLVLTATLGLPAEVRAPLPADHAASGFWRGLGATWWLWLAAMMLHWFAFGPYHYGFSLFLTEQGMDAGLTGLLWSLGVVAEILVFLGSGWFFARLGSRGVLLFAMGASFVRWVVLGLYPKPWVITVTQALHGPGFALFYAAAMQGIHRFSGDRFRASYQGLFSTCVSGVATILGMGFGGWLHERMPFHQVLLWMLPFQGAAVLLLWLVPREGGVRPRLASS